MSDYILCEKRNGIGILTLNSEKTLNALSLPMIVALRQTLTEWKTAADIHAVFLQGAGEKAFCAGGDVVRLYEAITAQRLIDNQAPAADCVKFFTEEYQVDYLIHQYPKPILVWADGIVMGGGLGLLAGASHRIVTDKSKMAMPEVTIGLYPDVGGTWFLNKMPSAWGLYLGLTGTRFNGVDCLYLGLGDYYVARDQKNALWDQFDQLRWHRIDNAHQAISEVLDEWTNKSALVESTCEKYSEFIAGFEKVESILEFQELLLAADLSDSWIAAGKTGFERGSPSSIAIIFEQLQRGKHWSLEAVFQSELNLSVQCTLHPDFAEGVRALLVDKDQNPKWQPASLKELTPDWVSGYFKALWQAQQHPLYQLDKK